MRMTLYTDIKIYRNHNTGRHIPLLSTTMLGERQCDKGKHVTGRIGDARMFYQ